MTESTTTKELKELAGELGSAVLGLNQRISQLFGPAGHPDLNASLVQLAKVQLKLRAEIDQRTQPASAPEPERQPEPEPETHPTHASPHKTHRRK